ncbi:RNA-binding protein [Candidatus Woesearchaeota archaeon]|nr:MAG: RNA-binding protein [Candidatus Woesearchaeota archaeon]
MKDEILMENKSIVVPGEVLAKGMSFLPGPGTYRRDDVIVAKKVGLATVDGKVIKLIALNGTYLPRVKDKIIARVIDVLMTGWRVDINCPYSAVLTMKDATNEFIPRGADLTKYYDLGDHMLCQVVNVTSQNLVDVSMKGPGLRKLKGGRFIKVSPYKVPRVIGKDGSMVSMIKKATGCDIIVGQNGVIWINGDPKAEVVAVKAIKKIDKEAHLSGLTDRIAKWLEEAK